MARIQFGLPLLIIALVTLWTYQTYVLYAVAIVLALTALRLSIKIYKFFRQFQRNLSFKEIDKMDGIEFERYIAQILKRQGYSSVRLTEQYDYGVDIVAEKDGVKWGVQVKRYSGLVKASAVRQVVTGLNFYNCQRAMVITNSEFSNVAKTLAVSNNCVLVNRASLLKLAR
ncbi:MAG: restriction endonuclease [Candidatus Microsaccharimonas sp.]